jgi:hypothetical protein
LPSLVSLTEGFALDEGWPLVPQLVLSGACRGSPWLSFQDFNELRGRQEYTHFFCFWLSFLKSGSFLSKVVVLFILLFF